MNAVFQKLSFRVFVFFLVSSASVRSKAQDTESFYSMSAVAAIDRENKLWRLVDPNEGVEANVQRLVAAGVSVGEVEKIKPRLIELWGDIDPSLQLDWLDRDTLTKIEALKTQYVVPMRRARIDDELDRLGGDDSAVTPYEITARWHDKIWSLLDLDQRDNFRLMNSARAIILCRLTKDLPTTTEERIALCRMQREYYHSSFSLVGDRPTQITINGKVALLNYWRSMRDFLGDERFTTYMRTSDAGFGRMAFVLDQAPEMTSKMILDLWWIRKKDQIEDLRPAYGRTPWDQRRRELYDSAVTVLGSAAMAVYLADDDSKWLEARPAPRMNGFRFRMAIERPGFSLKFQ